MPTLGEVRVLVVDDDEVLRELLTEALRREGHAVDAIDNGAEAIWLAQEVEFDVVILDWTLPDVDGVEVCRRLRDLERWMPLQAALVDAANEGFQARAIGAVRIHHLLSRLQDMLKLDD